MSQCPHCNRETGVTGKGPEDTVEQRLTALEERVDTLKDLIERLIQVTRSMLERELQEYD